MERWNDRENREFLRAGTIAASALNPYRDSKRFPAAITAFDIFPHLPKPAPILPTPEEAARNMERFFQRMDRQTKRKKQKQGAQA